MDEKRLQPADGLLRPIVGYLSGLRFPWLFGIVATLFGIDLLVPDLLPFVDEILLGLATILLGRWRSRKRERAGDSASD